MDPCKRLYDQFLMAARSIPANIAEGSSRHSTSIETEMRLTDVSRGSISELQGDFFNFILSHNQPVWSNQSQEYAELMAIRLDKPDYGKDVIYQVSLHVLRQKHKFDCFIENADPLFCANSLMFLCARLKYILLKQMDSQLEQFKTSGGFTENMTETRLEAKIEENLANGAPLCPVCGTVMRKVVARKGVNAGREFWSCSNYRKTGCRGTREIN